MSSTNSHRILACGLCAILILLLATTYHISALGTPDVPGFVTNVGSKVQNVGAQVQSVFHPESATTADEESSGEEAEVDPSSEKGTGELGKHFNIDLSKSLSKAAGIKGCEYPILIHVTPDEHCTGALALYGSIVRNVLQQPALQGKTCVHFTYVDPDLKTIQKMYRWRSRANPFTQVADCAALDTTPELNKLVPVRFNALVKIEKPDIMDVPRETWLTALNKVHSWGFDLYPRILLLDGDSMILTDLDKIMDEPSPQYTIVGAADQFASCRDRDRINGGMILLRPSRYFHVSALERLYDPKGSCGSGKWGQSEQELLNCICGTIGEDRGRPGEFACQVMPLYNSIWPRNYGCSAANVVPMRSIHFAAVPKPWKVEEKPALLERFDYGFWACARDAARLGDKKALTACDIPGLNVTRTVPEKLKE